MDSSQGIEAQNILDEARLQIDNNKKQENISDADANVEPQKGIEAAKDRIDDAVPKGPKKADESTGGRVQVAETGDLNELAAARRQS